MRVYLDNCCYNRPFDDQTQLKVRFETEAKMNRGAGDYTEWRKTHLYQNLSLEELAEEARKTGQMLRQADTNRVTA